VPGPIANPTSLTGVDVAEFLGRSGDAGLATLADEHLPVVAQLARSFTRGRGFADPAAVPADLLSVILAATARLVGNPRQLARDAIGIPGDFTREHVGSFNGWTLAELMVLNGYRRRSA